MRWYELIVESPLPVSEAVMALLHDFTSGIIIEEVAAGRRYRCYLPENPELEPTLEAIRVRMAQLPPELLEEGLPTFGHSWLEEEDWAHAWKAYFKPLRVGRRIVIKPTWHAWPPEDNPTAAREDDIVIELDPGMAFGTGAHATTRLCLAALEEHLQPGMTVVDLGCGSGLLSVAALRLGASRVVAIDNDALAVQATQENLERNGVAGCEVVLQAGIEATAGEFDLIVANISAAIIKQQMPLVAARIRPGGTYICSGFYEGYTEEISALLDAHGFQVTAEWAEELWACVHSVKR